MKLQKFLSALFSCLVIVGILPIALCSQESQSPPLFTPVSAEHSGILFTNHLIENDTFYMSTFIYAYNGGGVGIGDINNDGLPDIYFTGTQQHSPNKLYLNKGNLQFEDISAQAGVDDSLGVRFGVALVDIDADGDLDIYVSNQDFPNKLYLNNGDLTFTERASEFGIDYCCSSTQSNFFDYDRDGDLDLYIGVNGKAKESSPMVKGLPDILFRNDNGKFVDVSTEAKITDVGYALSTTIADFNQDGWPDIFVSNDFQEQDKLYINNGDGTFTDQATTLIRHSSTSSMGSDAADFNNDCRVDLVTLDMVPEQHWRKMSNATSLSVHHPARDSTQLPRNTLQINRGDGYFSDIGQLAGIAETDWSWSPLLADFDNDGLKDLFISNGFKRDMQNLDIINYLSTTSNPLSLTLRIPPVKVPNYAFRNNGDLTFQNTSALWGVNHVVNSNGAAFGDLDLDGDLDLVLNNLDSVAFLMKNNAVEQGRGNWLRVQLHGTESNVGGIGTQVEIQHNNKRQHSYMNPVRGYLSSVEPSVHFGLGDDTKVDALKVVWPDGSEQQIMNVAANQVIVLEQTAATIPSETTHTTTSYSDRLFTPNNTSGIIYRHRENVFDDFDRERMLPHKFSTTGPGIATGDVNQDGRDDVWIGGANYAAGALFFQQPDGSFLRSTYEDVLRQDTLYEDIGAVFVDTDNDGDLDLYVVSGGNAADSGSAVYQDRLYTNDGSGRFSVASEALPPIRGNGSCVVAADYDMDGDMDLFVGGHVVPGHYPKAPRSYLLQNNGGVFTDVTQKAAPGLVAPGLITAALWTDYDLDNDPDIMIVGEWMTPQIFRNENGKFVEATANSGLEGYEGWWNSITAGDFDNDGDCDYVVGNMGLNTKPELTASAEEPLRCYANDFDENTSTDIVMSYYYQGKEYPTRTREDMASQMGTYIRRKYPTTVAYALSTIQQMFPQPKLDSAHKLHATTLWSAYVENKGNGQFHVSPLPTLAQVSPIFGTIATDFNGDSHLDVLLTGNFFAPDRSVIRYDAGYGLLLVGNGTGTFTPLSFDSIGFRVFCDARSLTAVSIAGTNDIAVLAVCNDDWVINYRTHPPGGKRIAVDPKQGYTHCKIFYKDGREQRQEFYIGGGYLSQSSTSITTTPAIDRIEFYRGEVLAKTLRP